MKKLIALEEAALTSGALYFLGQHALGLPLWAWALLFFAPDISILGYTLSARAGAAAYNLLHHRGLALAIAAAGYFGQMEGLLAAGLLLFAHASFDRVLGYGLKRNTGFHHTHLGYIGHKAIAAASE